jgi:S-adenosylmethionine hydrolase
MATVEWGESGNLGLLQQAMAIITLTTDFGLADGYVGTMKGVILGIARDVQLVDLSHEVAPQGIRQAAYVLARAAPYFPAGTIHLAVVDPGVGSSRRPLIVQTPRATYVGPDNGLFTFALAERDARAWEPDRPEFWLRDVSRTFHGRDVFAPLAAHLASGLSPDQLGRPQGDPIRLALPQPYRHADGSISGHVAYVDRFGNLISDIPESWLGELSVSRWRFKIAGQCIAGLSSAYADVAAGQFLVLIGSGGTVEIAVRNGSAAARLGVDVDEAVMLCPYG